MNEPQRNTTSHWKALERRHHLAPFTNYKELGDAGGARIVVKAEGCWLQDSEGNKILDAMAGLWCVNVGYGNSRLADVAHEQMLELPYYNTFFKTAHPPVAELSEKLAAITPAGLEKAFYGSSGSEANDTMVRVVRRFWNLMEQPEKKIVISREWGYHGSTMASASLGGMNAMHKMSDLPLPGFLHVMPPYQHHFGQPGESEADFGLRAAKALEEKILELGPERVAAFIGEPIQGAGGVIIPPETYWPEIQRICKQYDVLLVADEVICGFGRTGAWFASDRLGIQPDLMTMAKGITSGYLPLSALMVGERVAQVLHDKGGEFQHGYTYDGHPVACAVALANIAIIEEQGLIERVRDDVGPYIAKAFAEALDGHPLVDSVRSFGLLGAIELKVEEGVAPRSDAAGKRGSAVRDRMIAKGLMMRGVWDTLVFSPPLIITREEIDQMVERAKAALDDEAKALGLAG
ncbi:MAG: aspartate aminotransferase family protein [Rhodospirillales bacterium]